MKILVKLKKSLFIFFFLFYLLSVSGEANQFFPKIEVSESELKNGKVLSLKGPWRFYWKKLILSKDLNNKELLKESIAVKVPSVWRDYRLNGKKLDPRGFGSYVLRLKIPKGYRNKKLGLSINKIFSSSKLFIDGQLKFKKGLLGETKRSFRPKYFPQTVFFYPKGSLVEIILQVSDYQTYFGGQFFPIYLGEKPSIDLFTKKRMVENLIPCGIFIIMGIYNLFLFLMQRKEKGNLFFGLYCLNLTFFTLLVYEGYLYEFFQNIPSPILRKVEFLNEGLGFIFFNLYLFFLFPQDYKKVPLKVIISLLTLFNITTLFFIPSYEFALMPFVNIFSGIILIYPIIVVFKALLNKRENAALFFGSFLGIFGGIVHDLLVILGVLKGGYFFIHFMVIFTIIQTYILARKFLGVKELEKMAAISSTALSLAHDIRKPFSEVKHILQSFDAYKNDEGYFGLNKKK